MKDRQKSDKVTQIRSGKGIRGKAAAVPKGPQKRHDWDAMERAFRTGKFTKTELSKKFGLALTSLVRRIKLEQTKDPTRWQQDLTKDIGHAAQALLIQAGVTATVQSGKAAEQIIAAAVVVRDVILEHRGDIKGARNVNRDMLAELQATTVAKDQLRAMLAIATEGTDDPAALAEAKEAFGRLLRLHTRISSLQKMTDAMQKLQTMERRAFNIPDEVEKQPENVADTLTDEQLQGEIARLEAELAATRPQAEPEPAPMLLTGT
jgi:hypothetical protein